MLTECSHTHMTTVPGECTGYSPFSGAFAPTARVASHVTPAGKYRDAHFTGEEKTWLWRSGPRRDLSPEDGHLPDFQF